MAHNPFLKSVLEVLVCLGWSHFCWNHIIGQSPTIAKAVPCYWALSLKLFTKPYCSLCGLPCLVGMAGTHLPVQVEGCLIEKNWVEHHRRERKPFFRWSVNILQDEWVSDNKWQQYLVIHKNKLSWKCHTCRYKFSYNDHSTRLKDRARCGKDTQLHCIGDGSHRTDKIRCSRRQEGDTAHKNRGTIWGGAAHHNLNTLTVQENP